MRAAARLLMAVYVITLIVIDLVFGLVRSVSRAVGKQFEIFSLILLRHSFKAFAELPEPPQWPTSLEPIWHIFTDAVGALATVVLRLALAAPGPLSGPPPTARANPAVRPWNGSQPMRRFQKASKFSGSSIGIISSAVRRNAVCGAAARPVPCVLTAALRGANGLPDS